jgi:protein Tex
MIEKHLLQIVQELSLQPRQVAATAVLLEEGATVPFIARYRKERTGELDEVQIANIRDRMQELEELDKRRDSILASLTERNLLTEELKVKIESAKTLSTLEDLYLPFRPKKRTRATMAKEKGLEPLADILWEQNSATDPEAEAAAFVSAEKEVPDAAAALAGARDILAERINDSAEARAALRALYLTKGVLKSKVVFEKEKDAAKFQDYFDWSEPVAQCPSHRFLAIRRGETEGLLFSRITPQEEEALAALDHLFVKGSHPAAQQVRLAAHDGFKRLLGFAMEGEARVFYKKKADEEAIRVFAENLRELLLASPLGQKTVLALDPGFRTGCKLVVLDPQGKLLMNEVVYPEKGARDRAEAAEVIKSVVSRFKIEAIAIGNGTASRETESFVRALGLPAAITIVVVSESGASIYSASEVAREEFPNLDLTVRGAISIGRRLMDPLAELVKIDPKSIGVGQYQHDVDQSALKRSLDDTVVSCVNHVGVELNTASANLLGYVSGLNTRTAQGIVEFRNQNGPFKSRQELLKVPGLGPKAFEQAAGFLRIRNGAHPLDASAVHPERYDLLDQMAADLGCSVGELLQNPARRSAIKPDKYITPDIGLPTLQDILKELAKPGRDPRKQFEVFSFSDEAMKIQDLKPGMKLPGLVTNVAAFGAFIDVGVHQDGLAHISQLSDQFVKNPSDVVKVGQKVNATVLEVDLERKRISLSLKSNPEIGAQSRGPRDASSGTRNFQPRAQQKQAPQVDWFTAAMNRRNS